MADQRYRLKLDKLQFCSIVDNPAQPHAKTLLIKRAAVGAEITATARIAKIDEELGLAFFWAFTSTNPDGSDHYDLQGDCIDADFVKSAMDFMTDGGGAVDEMHDGVPGAGRVVFAMPMTPDIASSFGIASKTIGLMIAIKPAPDVLAKLKDGTYNGVSIGGSGERTAVNRSVGKATWSAADQDSLPDSSFLYVAPGGTKTDGKTTPLSLRQFPYRDANGKVDIDHLRAACQDIPKSTVPVTQRNKLQIKAEKLLAAQHTKRAPTGKCADCGEPMGVADKTCTDCGGKQATKNVGKVQAVLTSETDGHQHTIDVDDPLCGWDSPSTSYQTAEGADNGHSHSWTFDRATGVITIGVDSGHTHTIAATVPANVLAAATAIETAEDDRIDAIPAEVAANDSDGIPITFDDEESSAKVQVTVIAARAPAIKSTPARAVPNVKPQPETIKMNLAKALAAILAMSAAQRDYVAKLAPDEIEPFLAKSTPERDAIFKSAAEADPVVFKGEKTGVEVRKSDGDLALKMAKHAESSAVELAKAQEQVGIEKAARELVELTKRANDTLGNLAGTDAAHIDVLRSVESIADVAKRDAAIATLKAANAAMKSQGKAKGAGGVSDPVAHDKKSAYDALAKGVVAFAKTNNIAKVWTDGLAAFVQTPEGAELQRVHAEASA